MTGLQNQHVLIVKYYIPLIAFIIKNGLVIIAGNYARASFSKMV